MDDNVLYIKRRDLRELGFTQPDEIFLPFLHKINQDVIKEIDRELRMEMDANTLTEYTKLLKENTFASPVMQDWLKRRMPDIESIAVDRVNIMLADLKSMTDNNQPSNVTP